MLELLGIVLYFMRLHPLKKEKNIKKLFQIQMALKWLLKIFIENASSKFFLKCFFYSFTELLQK
jgi:uncharacterized membrane protein YwzB